MKHIVILIILAFSFTSCQSQNNSNILVGGPCEGCEAIFEYGNKRLTSVDTLPLFKKNEPKLKITGIVYKKDGKTPARGVIVYIYHTNRKGIYQTKGDEQGWAKRHGFIRGWVKTNSIGAYTFYTFRPGAYPNRAIPEHIHITIKEPSKNEYYIDDFKFEDDHLLTSKERNKLKNRGGSGLVIPKHNGKIHEITRNIILGLNIPSYD